MPRILSGRVIQGERTVYTAIPCWPYGREGQLYWSLPCVECGGQYQVRPRTLRDMINSGRDPLCAQCRTGPTLEEHMAWWLEHFSLEECAFMYRCIEETLGRGLQRAA